MGKYNSCPRHLCNRHLLFEGAGLYAARQERIGYHLGGFRVGPEISPTRLSGPRQGRRTAKAVCREAGQEGHVRSARITDARHSRGVALRAVWNGAEFQRRDGRKVSEMRFRSAFLPAMHLLRHFYALRMQPADPRTDRAQRRTQLMSVLLHASPCREGDFDADCRDAAGCASGV